MKNPLPEMRSQLAALAVAATLVACGGAAALVVPFFTFGFGFSGIIAGQQRAVAVNLAPNAPTTADGVFDVGTTNVTVTPPGGQVNMTGTFSGCTFSLSVPGAVPPLATSYSGRFTNKDTIELMPQAPSPGMPTLTLQRQNGGTDTRTTTC